MYPWEFSVDTLFHTEKGMSPLSGFKKKYFLLSLNVTQVYV